MKLFARRRLAVVVSLGAPPTRPAPARLDLRTRAQRESDQAALDAALGLSGRAR